MELFWDIVWALGKIVVFVIVACTGLSAVLTWMERRQSAMMQDRIGPVRANLGKWRLKGLVHPIADATKLLFKEDFVPPGAKRSLFILAPILALTPVLVVFAVIPFGPTICAEQLGQVLPQVQPGDYASVCVAGTARPLQVAQIDIGLLLVFAFGTLGVYGTVLAGWASNNNYGLLGGMRGSAQMLSYEVTMGLAIMGIFLVYGTLEPMALVEKQSTFFKWGVFQQPLGFVLFFAAAIAETKRAPFDIPEGESEIVGYFVEYSGARFTSFYLGEFLEIVFVGCVVATVFFGGWQVPFLFNDGWHVGSSVWHWPHWLVSLARVGFFFFKVFCLCFLQLTIRWTLPRLRYDQLMRLGWKGLLPASIINVVITAAVVLATMPSR